MVNKYNPYADSSAELLHRYGGTYLGLKKVAEITPILIRNIVGASASTRNFQYASFSKAGVVNYEAGDFKSDSIHWYNPPLGYYQLNGKKGYMGLYLEYEAERQPKKGFQPSMVLATIYHYVTGHGLQKITANRLNILLTSFEKEQTPNPFTVWSIYNPTYHTLPNILEEQKSRRLVPVSKDTAIYIYPKERKPNYIVLHRNGVVGSIREGRLNLLAKYEAFREEVSENLKLV